MNTKGGSGVQEFRSLRIFIVLFFLFLGLVFYIPSPEFDFWWHLKTGEMIWRLKAVPHAGIFSFGKTMRWVHHEWLSDVIFYLIARFFSLSGLLFFRAVVLSAACYFIFKMCLKETQNILLSLCVTFFCALVLVPWKPGAGLRPQFFTLFFTALAHYLLFYRKKPQWLPVLFFLWANLHGGYVSGFILLFAFCVSEKLSGDGKRFLNSIRLFALCFVAGLLTPNHIYELIYPFQIFLRRDLYGYNFEWFPPDIHKMYAFPFFAFAGAFLLSCALRRRFRDGEVFFLFPYLLLSAFSLRNMPLFPLVVSPFLTRQADEGLKTLSPRKQKSFLYICFGFLMIFLTALYVKTVPVSRQTLSPSVLSSQVPENALNFIKENKLPGPLFPEPDWGGYVIFKLYPAYKVGVDTRFDTVYDKDYLVRAIKAFSGALHWETIFNETHTNLILLDAIATPLKEELYASDTFKLIYADEQSVLFMRNRSSNRAFIARFYTKELKARQRVYYCRRHGQEKFNAGNFEKAQSLFLEAISYEPRDAQTHYWLGITFLKQKT